MIRIQITLSIVLLAVIASGCQTVRGPMTVQVHHSSPGTILASYQEALAARDYSAILDCIDPAYRQKYDALLWSRKSYDDKIKDLDGLLKKQFGADQAQVFQKKMVKPFEGVGLYLPDGIMQLDVAHVGMISDSGQLIYPVIDGERSAIAAKKVGRMWYVAILEGKEEFASRARTERLILSDLCEWSEHVTEGIRDRSITSDNIMDILSLERMPPRMHVKPGVTEESYLTFPATSRPDRK